MQRILRRNRDAVVTVAPPVPTDEKHDLYQRYLNHQHDETMSRTYEAFREFLYNSPMPTFEFSYRIGDRLAGISIADRCESGLSSVYMFFEPELAPRSLGTFSVLWEIDYCRREGFPYYYLGFYIAGAPTMSYKAHFRPYELLVAEERWVTLRG